MPHSLSKVAPFASVVVLISMPSLFGANQRSTSLVNWDHWKAEVRPKVEARGVTMRACGMFAAISTPLLAEIKQ